MEQRKIISNFGSSDYGTVAFVDLDGFKNCMEEMGWARWHPNPMTELLTRELLHFIRKYFAVHIWGLNEKEGTEEAILIFFQESTLIVELFESLRKKVLNLAQKLEAPTSLSVGIASGRIIDTKPITHHRKSDFQKDPTRYLAYKALKEAKRKGGNIIIKY